MKRSITLLLALIAVISAFSLVSCGDDKPGTTSPATTGTDDDIIWADVPEIDVDWTVDSEGTLTISGQGQMKDFTLEAYNQAPWHSEKDNIKKVIIKDGVVSIGEWAFEFCSSLTSITIPDSVKLIGDGAFYNCGSLKSITIPDSVTAIGTWAFKNCEGLTIYCSSGSYAQKYAAANGIPSTDKSDK